MLCKFTHKSHNHNKKERLLGANSKSFSNPWSKNKGEKGNETKQKVSSYKLPGTSSNHFLPLSSFPPFSLNQFLLIRDQNPNHANQFINSIQ